MLKIVFLIIVAAFCITPAKVIKSAEGIPCLIIYYEKPGLADNQEYKNDTIPILAVYIMDTGREWSVLGKDGESYWLYLPVSRLVRLPKTRKSEK